MQGWGFWAVVSGLLLAPVGFYYLYRTGPVQRLLSYLLNKSQLYKSIKTQLFCLAMGMSTRVGMEITRALKLSKQVLGDARLENKIERVIEQVRQGHSLTDSLGEQGFDSLPLDSLRAGEESGNLEEVFTFQADLLGEDISRQLDRLVTVIEPIVIFAMAFLVGLIMASVLLPIFSLTSSL
jgi:type IV pilus assembly protein PilC